MFGLSNCCHNGYEIMGIEHRLTPSGGHPGLGDKRKGPVKIWQHHYQQKKFLKLTELKAIKDIEGLRG